MMNKYIKIKANAKNEFRTKMSLEFNGYRYEDIDVKLDTGCPETTFLTDKIAISSRMAKKLKRADSIDDGVKKTISFGVNDSRILRQKMSEQFRKGDYDSLTSVSFAKEINDISIGGVYIGDKTIKVNYDRTGNILIGVDIIKEWDVHIGTDKNGDTIFLACPKNMINVEYLYELEKLLISSTHSVRKLTFA